MPSRPAQHRAPGWRPYKEPAKQVRKRQARRALPTNSARWRKIREAQLQKVPYMLVVGDREAAEGAVAVRSRAQGDLGARPVAAFVHEALAEVARKQVS